jgi:phage baseplate assembly protein W
MDLPLYSIDTANPVSAQIDALQGSYAGEAPVTSIEVIANKVVKFLLTATGSDPFEPTYGSSLMTYTQIVKGILPQIQLELIGAIARCTAYIKASEPANAPDTERLHSITLTKMVFGGEVAADVVHVYINIKTIAGNDAMLQIPIGNN